MKKVTRKISIHRDIESVFNYLDDPKNHEEFTPSIHKAKNIEQLENGGKKVDFVFSMYGFKIEGELTEVQRNYPSRMVFKMDGNLSGFIEIDLVEKDDSVELVYTGQYAVFNRFATKLLGPIIGKYNRKELSHTVQNIKSKIES